jgi:N-methylhydantoinase B
MRSGAVDPITFQVVVSRLSGIVQEMQDSIFRTGYSTIVRESHDASCLLLDAEGEVIGEHVVAPLHITSLPGTVRAVRRRFGDDIAPGDAFITNHPFEADVPHSVDMALIMPIFAGDRLIAFAGSIAHKSDLGGVVPGTVNGSARDAFQEGIYYPPVRFLRRGGIVSDVESILRANSRTPDTILGDLRGQVGVGRLGERRLLEVVERYGVETLLDVFREILDRAEQRMRALLTSLPDGSAEAEGTIDGDDSGDAPVRFHVRIEKVGGHIVFDFTRSSDQVLMPINIRPPVLRGACYFAIIGMFDPTIQNNGGLARVVEIKTRLGSIVDAKYPAPTNTYLPSATVVTEIVITALSRIFPDKQVAEAGGVGSLSVGGRRRTGELYSSYELIGSAYGARAGKDGLSGTSVFHTNSHTAPIEIIESEFPMRIEQLQLICDSGGAGTYRGGLGAVRQYVILNPEVLITLRGGKHAVPAAGMDGGGPARLGACIINPNTPHEKRLPSRFGGVPLREHDVIRIEKSGGGGLHAPAGRPFERIVDDVLDGYVSRAAAIEVYGADPDRLDARIREWHELEVTR